MHGTEYSLFLLHLAEHVYLRDRGQWRQVHAQHCRHVFSVIASPSQVPLGNRSEALQVELNNDEDEGSSRLQELPRLSWPMSYIKTAYIQKKKTGHCHRKLFPDGNREPNMQTSPTS